MTKFIYGVATSAYQIEGADNQDGKGPSIWDEFVKRPQAIIDNSTGKIACDHYNRLQEDVALLKKLGVNAYRFSISWPRIMPTGCELVNSKGIAFYNKLIDLLLAAKITPYVTLYHWDLPLELEKIGGWLNPKISDYFMKYAEVIANEFGTRVKYFITINEPQVIIGAGLNSGVHAPGKSVSKKEQLQAIHNLLLAHGKANLVIKKCVPDAKVSIAPCGAVAIPLSTDEKTIAAARDHYFDFDDNWFSYSVSIYSDPIVFGDYPPKYYELFSDIMPKITKRDLEIISTPLDFYCQNIYSGTLIKLKCDKIKTVEYPPNYPRSTMGWPLDPRALYWGVRFLSERYQLDLLITENGASFDDRLNEHNQVLDYLRITYLKQVFSTLKNLREEKYPLRGYFYWTMFDNFEWSYGFSKRFGFVYVDFKTLKRYQKLSFSFYQKMIKKDAI